MAHYDQNSLYFVPIDASEAFMLIIVKNEETYIKKFLSHFTNINDLALILELSDKDIQLPPALANCLKTSITDVVSDFQELTNTTPTKADFIKACEKFPSKSFNQQSKSWGDESEQLQLGATISTTSPYSITTTDTITADADLPDTTNNTFDANKGNWVVVDSARRKPPITDPQQPRLLSIARNTRAKPPNRVVSHHSSLNRTAHNKAIAVLISTAEPKGPLHGPDSANGAFAAGPLRTKPIKWFA
jgi:hypothetical protein